MKSCLKLTALVAIVLIASMASAQVRQTGTLVVTVSDPQGGRLPGAVVSASAEDTVTPREMVTNSQGVATLQALDPSAKYVVTIQMAGFAPSRSEDVLVRSGHTAALSVTMNVAGIAEEVTVTSVTPLVDTTSALTGQDITYLQLVPGVLPDDPQARGNPASKSGLNYRDIFGDNGVSRDNFYYIDGVNTTDGYSGTFGSNLNTEIIQEQKVLTGGIPAEYVGAPGLISSVVTKSGTNTFHGSGNYFFQNDSMEAEDQNAESQSFSRYDTAFTLGGPIVMDKAWFFVSYRRVERTNDIATLDTAEFLRSVDTTENQWYLRGTVSPGASDTISFTYFSDPFTRTGSLDRSLTNARSFDRDQGGDNFRIAYSHLFGTDVLLDANYSRHNGELTDFPTIAGPRNTIIYRASDVRTLEDEQQGGFAFTDIDERDGQGFNAVVNWTVEQHDVKGGIEWGERSRFRNLLNEGDWNSLATHLSGTTAGEISVGSFSDTAFDPFNTSDFNGFMDSVNASPRRNEFFNAFDTNRDGMISQTELATSLRYTSTEGNPTGQINYERNVQVEQGPQDWKVNDFGLFAQDTFSFGNFVFNVGLRAERYEHQATTGETIYTFPWTWAPRLSAVYDIGGKGLQKASVFWGKYYDPIRLNMTAFAGTLSGSISNEQVFALDEWVTYRVRGGPSVADALFAPTTQTPFTTDLQLTYEIEVAPKMSFQALYTHRKTDDILEDYDMCLYAFQDDGTTCYPGPVDHPDSLFLGLDYFGYSSFPDSNFVIATLAGAERTYDGFELVFRKRYADGWQALVSYTYSDGEGNSNSDSNADFQGDVLFLDPRAPNQLGTQPGLIHHLFKVAGTYRFDMGLELGAFYRWNSGTIASTTFRAFNRNLPVRDNVFEFAGITQRWLEPDAVGSLENPSFGILDLRVQYYINQGGRVTGQVFADIFNVSNFQDSTRDQDLRAGQGGVAFGEGILFNRPRSLFLGVRVNW
jgi:hypothetical protein